jgi:hypothetical protein
MKKPAGLRRPACRPRSSEQQLEYPDHHDQADDEDDACGPADEFQHAMLSGFFQVCDFCDSPVPEPFVKTAAES